LKTPLSPDTATRKTLSTQEQAGGVSRLLRPFLVW